MDCRRTLDAAVRRIDATRLLIESPQGGAGQPLRQ
jgi:hypothetical protein